jgi:putative ABC transport system permease protein
MTIRPILSSLSRNKFGAVLIATQIAITLGFLANALAIVEYRLSWSSRPSGMDEANLFSISSDSVDHPADSAAGVHTDLATLRALPGVVDAFADYGYPFSGGGWVSSVNLSVDQKTETTETAVYLADEHALSALGVHLIAGRNFTADEITDRREGDKPTPDVLIVTKTLADRLFPAGNALGQTIYVTSDQPERIIGIVDRLQAPVIEANGATSTIAEHSVLGPYRPIDERSDYLVRVTPGQLDAVMKSAEKALLTLNGDRILRIRSMEERRRTAYRGDQGLVVLLISVCTALVAVTGFGIVGLTSYWVTQRRQQIGIRRALGATRRDIVAYFQTENLLIAGLGAAAGVLLAIALNLWLVRSFEMVRMPGRYALIGAAIMLILRQLAVLWPARRAASIPPALATRGG